MRQVTMFAESRAYRYWERVPKFDVECRRLADRHYSRRTMGSPQFMPPGQTIVLAYDGAVYGWWRPDPSADIIAMNGLDGWTCTIFRNESAVLSSELIINAELALVAHATDCGRHGMITYVWDKKVRSSNPGCCYKIAGWRRPVDCGFAEVAPRSVDSKKSLLMKPWAEAGICRHQRQHGLTAGDTTATKSET